jgi:hypothetical protein
MATAHNMPHRAMALIAFLPLVNVPLQRVSVEQALPRPVGINRNPVGSSRDLVLAIGQEKVLEIEIVTLSSHAMALASTDTVSMA